MTTLGSTMAAESDMRGLANDRALKNLGVRELNLGFLPEGAKIVNLPNQVSYHIKTARFGWRLVVVVVVLWEPVWCW